MNYFKLARECEAKVFLGDSPNLLATCYRCGHKFKIKDMFEMAKRTAPCILFIDEIDAIGQRRSAHSFNDQDREQTLNQLLSEMDGFGENEGTRCERTGFSGEAGGAGGAGGFGGFGGFGRRF